MKQLTIRKNGNYYQVGYSENSKWVNVQQLGRPEKLVRQLKLLKYLKENVPKIVAEFEAKMELDQRQKYQEADSITKEYN